MARKHLLASISSAPAQKVGENTPSEARADYARRGASRSMMQSLDEMAENSMRVLEGETIVKLDPDMLDASVFADRISDDEEDFASLVEAIKQAGQSSPILVRPHPDEPNRYMIVYGHRRARAAKTLGIKVRAVIKPVQDIAHVIAQGQENTARANLTFIEKSLFARKLSSSGMTKDVIKTALTVDDTLLSRMLSVVDNVPEAILEAVGSAKGVGRDRWEDVKKLVMDPARASWAIAFVAGDGFRAVSSEARFNVLLEQLKNFKRPKQKSGKPLEKSWDLAEKAVAVSTRDAGRAFTLSLKSKDASRFGAFISEQLEDLYRDFQRTETERTGD
ncbi:plasmid partitioning protein RepB [Pararhizobium sp. YC-54]|uniref:plasmid partitioning protein RepB n=1 Tax=Pararhizobium sp. YC-54 TaxID=2986920 RepID=UPI0021F7071D|nr:plasmid partitioning protein RepB [Pararhizobium sp. YC-54]MCW0000599.1 plasmid partitioning protein RepB [Pararhizobium sp. YC-54]